ncbi:hypothetical protein FK268_03360 [Tsukamurella sputi]|uniref:Uncharacterized protein n=1 Tax=Tsukamurella sputi TaxID=2591848 RepID=A0A5C5RT80_9ACTN|nr:hypothetical protein [Tsukamurella sputi]TWS26287.1 hypothetical protein FK268_03360 [Tsukamurella sputi]
MAGSTQNIFLITVAEGELDLSSFPALTDVSFAVDRRTPSPGYGRLAAIVTVTPTRHPLITHLGWLHSARNRTNLDATWILSNIKSLERPIPISELQSATNDPQQEIFSRLNARRGAQLGTRISKLLRAELRNLTQSSEWPVGATPNWIDTRTQNEVTQNHSNAVGTALMFGGMSPDRISAAPLPGSSPLEELRVSPSEPSLIDHDLRTIPGMTGDQRDHDVFRFTNGRNTVDVINVNATGIETATGVDLIYFNHDFQSFVLVQYKRMTISEHSARISGVDERFLSQLDRMKRFDSVIATTAIPDSSEAFRLYPGSTFVKFAYPLASPSKGADLTRGMYVPSNLLRILDQEGALATPRGARAVTHDNLKRWLSNDDFVSLVRNGWVGTSNVAISDIARFVRESLRLQRITVVAAHQSDAQLTATTPNDA